MMRQKDDGYIRFRCKACGKRLKIKKHHEGGNIVPCRRCRAPINIPLANPEAILEAGLDWQGEVSAVNYDPKSLLPQMESEQEKRRSDSREGLESKGQWSPEAGLSRLQELDDFRVAVGRLEDEAADMVQKLLRQRNLTRRAMVREMQRIGQERARRIQDHLQSRKKELEGKLARLEAKGGHLAERGRRRIRQLRSSLVALELYVRHVLGAGP